MSNQPIPTIFNKMPNLTTSHLSATTDTTKLLKHGSAAAATGTVAEIAAGLEKLAMQQEHVQVLVDSIHDLQQARDRAIETAKLYAEELDARKQGDTAGLIGPDSYIESELRIKALTPSNYTQALKHVVASLHNYLQEHV